MQRTHRIVRRFEFDAGHRIVGHESKCAHLHGHRYRADVTIDAPVLDGIGRVIDFGKVKEIIGGWIDANWDHNMIFNKNDPVIQYMGQGVLKDIFAGKTPYILDTNPTAEVLVEVLFNQVCFLLAKVDKQLIVHKVVLWETPNCWAEYSLG